jgi:hypothetical protein
LFFFVKFKKKKKKKKKEKEKETVNSRDQQHMNTSCLSCNF